MHQPTILAVLAAAIVSTTPFAVADDRQSGTNYNSAVDKALEPAKKWPGVIRSNIGVTRLGTKIPCLMTKDDLDHRTQKARILLIGGLDGTKRSVRNTLEFLNWFHTSAAGKKLHKTIAISAVPIANPDGWGSGKGPGNLSGGSPSQDFPPKGTAYNSKSTPESSYLWRWIGTQAPDNVWVVGVGGKSQLMNALRKHPPADVGMVETLPKRDVSPGTNADADIKRLIDFMKIHLQLISVIQSQKKILSDTENRTGKKPKQPDPFAVGKSARAEMRRRINRSPVQIAGQLSKRYGHNLRSVAYIPALALIGRLRLGELTNDPAHRQDVEKIVAPYFTGKKPTYGKRISGSMMPGHLVFGELARTETDPKKRARYIALAKRAADLGFDDQGKMKRSMPAHSEMSDSVFMGGPILTQVGRLTGESKYFDMAVRHTKFMLKLNLRKDGLHRHSPLDETAWGRGNGFPALGLALCLSDLPKKHSGHAAMLAAFRAHMQAMARHQDPTGMWHQVVDHDESYRELTVTCMTTFAMIRGIRRGWLDEKTYGPIVHRAFTALKTRIAPNATLIDVCTGTGKQRSLREYYDRTAILGYDDRGGAMSLMVTSELAQWQREQAKAKK